VRPPGFFLITERMRLFSSPHPQLSVIPPRAISCACGSAPSPCCLSRDCALLLCAVVHWLMPPRAQSGNAY
jgi:hypothetical protein